jgi:hypothetical protein
MAVTTKNAVFLDVAQCGSCKNRRFGGMWHLHPQGDKNQRARNNVSSNKPPKHAAKENAIRSSETSVLTGATMRNIPADNILHIQRSEKLKSLPVFRCGEGDTPTLLGPLERANLNH